MLVVSSKGTKIWFLAINMDYFYEESIVVFLNRKQMVQHAIPSLMVKTMEQYVIPISDSCVRTITSFDF